MNDHDWQPLLSYCRAGIAEVVKFGAISWVSGTDVIHETGGNPLCFGRSLMKPWQMKGITAELAEVLNKQQQALSLASHNAELTHLTCAKSILPEIEHALLKTPSCLPLMPNEQVSTADKWNHPCSGKHAAIIRACQLNHWPLQDYLSETHPYHQVFIQAIRSVIGENWQPQAVAIDGCGLPAFSQSVREMAQLFASLVTTQHDDWIWSAMVDNPDLIGGNGRLDSAIMTAGKGKVLAKEGADGLLGLAIDHPKYPDGLGIVIKLSHGWDGTASGFVAAHLLASLGIDLPLPTAPEGQTAQVADNLCPRV